MELRAKGTATASLASPPSAYRWVVLGYNVMAHAAVVIAGQALAPLAP